MIALCELVRTGGFCAALPERFADLAAGGGVRALPLRDPDASRAVGLVALDRDPQPSLIAGLFESAAELAEPEA